MKSYETATGDKQQCRDLLCKLARKHSKPGKILTLPGEKGLCVQTFHKAFPKAVIRGVERDKGVFAKASKLPHMDLMLGTVRDYVESEQFKSRHHDLIFLDYLGNLTDSVLTDVRTLVANRNIIHACETTVLGVTVMKAMRQGKAETLKIGRDLVWLEPGEQIENCLEHVSLMIMGAADVQGLVSLELLEKREYRATATSATMYFVVLKIEA